MLKKLVVFALCIVAIKASGVVHVLKAPESLDFKGNEKLDSESLGDVVSAALGFYVDDATNWSGLYINNPFNLVKNAIVVIVPGIKTLNLKTKTKSYPLVGSSSEESLNALSSDLESSNVSVAIMDFSRQFNDALVTMADVFGDTPAQVSALKSTKNLKPDLHSEDKEFLTQLAYINEVISKYSTSSQLPSLLVIRLSVESIAKAHGEKSPAMADASTLVANMLEDFYQATKDNQLLLAVAEKPDLNRAKRETVDGASAKSLNLAAYYNEDYPVIFNIILWFMVVLGFSLLAICYAIGSMDPGRDSIIYRMTSTRMKKDN